MKFLNLRIIIASLLRIRSIFFKNKPDVCIITLHNISENQFKWFEDFIAFIDKNYGFINPNDFISKQKNVNNGVLLTFDDGFRSNRIVAESILKKYNVKAMFFITEKFVGLNKKDSFIFSQMNFYPNSIISQEKAKDYKAMSWGDVDWLIGNGHIIGAHTATHKMLSKIDNLDLLKDEIQTSADRLESKIKNIVRIFAFPFGTPDSMSTEAFKLSKNRFDYVFSNIRGGFNKSPDNYFIFRQNIVPEDPMWLIKLIIDGQFDWKYKKIVKFVFEKFYKKLN